MFFKSLFSFALLATYVVSQNNTVSDSVVVRLSNEQRIIFDSNGSGPLDVAFAKIFNLNGTYRWIGVSGVSMIPSGLRSFASPDLMTWHDEGIFADFSASEFAAAASPGGLGRPHILFNEATNKYVLWGNAQGGFFSWTSNTPLGPWTFKGRVATPPPPAFSGDFTIDTINGSAFVSYSLFDFSKAGFIWPPFDQSQVLQELTSDFTNVTGPTFTIQTAANDQVDRSTEAPGFFERNGFVYLTASTTCGNCNDAPLVVYRTKNIKSNIWARQIISGDTCKGQTSGVLTVLDTVGKATYLHTSDLWRGFGPISLHGKGLQVLSFNQDGSLKDLDCNPKTTFGFNAVRGNGTFNAGKSSQFTDSSDPNALYEPTCDLDRFSIYQTWMSSKGGNLQEVGVNIGSTDATTPVAFTIFRFKSNAEFFTPGQQFEVLFNQTFAFNQTASGSAITKLNPKNVTVAAGDRLGIAITGAPGQLGVAGSYCYLSRKSATTFSPDTSTRGFFFNLAGDVSPRGIDGTVVPVKIRESEISWYSIVS